MKLRRRRDEKRTGQVSRRSDLKSPQFACSARTRRGELVQDRG
jgi:hypothetical protein